MTTAVFPGSFDPPTLGHVDLAERGAHLFEHLIVAVLDNPDKTAMFTTAERVDLLKQCLGHLSNVEITSFGGLLVDFAHASGATALLRGLRAVSDFEYEFQMALMNRRLEGTVETVFLMPREDCVFLSSRIVKQIHAFGRVPPNLVPPAVEEAMRKRLKGNRT